MLFIAGLVSNIASIVTFLSADMRKQTFNQLLAILAAIDILWVCRYILLIYLSSTYIKTERVYLFLKGRDVVKRAFMFAFIKFCIHFRASTGLTHQRFYLREYFTNLKVENVGNNFLFSQNYFYRYIVTNVPVHANATLPPVRDLVSVSTFLSELYVQ